MRKTLFDALPPSVTSPGKSVSASTQAGASCVFELRDIVWRRSSHALDGGDCAVASAGAGRASVTASCAFRRQTAAKKIANAGRGSIKWARLIHTQPALQAPSLMRPELQAVCHFEDRREYAEYDESYQNRNYHDDDRRNQLRDHPHGSIKLALIYVRDRLCRFRKMSGLFAHGHHVSKQIRKELLLLQRSREGCAVNDCFAHLAQFRFEKTVAGDLSHEIQ